MSKHIIDDEAFTDPSQCDLITSTKGGTNVQRKRELEHSKAIHCGYCKVNRGENSKRIPFDRLKRHHPASAASKVARRQAGRTKYQQWKLEAEQRGDPASFLHG